MSNRTRSTIVMWFIMTAFLCISIPIEPCMASKRHDELMARNAPLMRMLLLTCSEAGLTTEDITPTHFNMFKLYLDNIEKYQSSNLLGIHGQEKLIDTLRLWEIFTKNKGKIPLAVSNDILAYLEEFTDPGDMSWRIKDMPDKKREKVYGEMKKFKGKQQAFINAVTDPNGIKVEKAIRIAEEAYLAGMVAISYNFYSYYNYENFYDQDDDAFTISGDMSRFIYWTGYLKSLLADKTEEEITKYKTDLERLNIYENNIYRIKLLWRGIRDNDIEECTAVLIGKKANPDSNQ